MSEFEMSGQCLIQGFILYHPYQHEHEMSRDVQGLGSAVAQWLSA